MSKTILTQLQNKLASGTISVRKPSSSPRKFSQHTPQKVAPKIMPPALVSVPAYSPRTLADVDSPFVGNPVVKLLSQLEDREKNRNECRSQVNSIRAELVNGTYRSMDLNGMDTTSLQKETAEGEAVLKEYEVRRDRHLDAISCTLGNRF